MNAGQLLDRPRVVPAQARDETVGVGHGLTRVMGSYCPKSNLSLLITSIADFTCQCCCLPLLFLAKLAADKMIRGLQHHANAWLQRSTADSERNNTLNAT